jgi:Subtilase family
MSDVICFNCRSVVPHWKNCANCAAPLPDYVEAGAPTASDASSVLQMDPHLRRLTALVQTQGIRKLASSSTGENEVSVIARVTDVDTFKSLSGVKVVTVINPATAADDWIVTAQIPLYNGLIEEIRRNPSVKSLKASRRLSPCLERTCEDTFATEAVLPAGNLAQGGKGVIIGIIDFGMDFAHKNFRNPDGTSRILALWDQRPEGNPRSPSHFGYGTEHRKAEIDAALQTLDPYATLQYAPSENSSLQLGAHATAVADVAAGNGLGTSCPGIAPQADIVFVELSTKEIPAEGSAVLDNSFGGTRQLLEAIQYIFDFASDRPCVINISLATNGGPHDGSTPVECGIDQLVSATPNRAVVVAAGNSFDRSIHAFGSVTNGGKVGLKWRIPPEDPSSNELEVWFSGKDRYTLDVFDPQDKRQLTVEPGLFNVVRVGEGIISAHNRLSDPNNDDNTIDVFFDRNVPDGDWTIQLHGDSVKDGTFHAWIERDEIRQSHFVSVKGESYEVNDDCTIGSISCGKKTIVVGAYDAHQASKPLFKNSSAGKTRDNRNKPEVSAPGDLVLVAESKEISRNRQSGTSLSAPAVTGIVALMLAEAKARGISLAADQIRNILVQAARKDPPAANGQLSANDGWDRQYGYGRVSAADAVAAVIDIAPRNNAGTQA